MDKLFEKMRGNILLCSIFTVGVLCFNLSVLFGIGYLYSYLYTLPNPWDSISMIVLSLSLLVLFIAVCLSDAAND